MSFRYSWWAEIMGRSGELGTISHMLVRFNQLGVQRYIDEGNSWMLSKAEARGGALLNLGFHGFDLCRYITGEEPKGISAVTSHSLWNREVEDYAFVTLRTPGGMVFLNEASYTFPTTGSDSERKIAAKNALVRTSATGDGVQIIGPGRNETLNAPGGTPGVGPASRRTAWTASDAANRLPPRLAIARAPSRSPSMPTAPRASPLPRPRGNY